MTDETGEIEENKIRVKFFKIFISLSESLYCLAIYSCCTVYSIYKIYIVQ